MNQQQFNSAGGHRSYGEDVYDNDNFDSGNPISSDNHFDAGLAD